MSRYEAINSAPIVVPATASYFFWIFRLLEGSVGAVSDVGRGVFCALSWSVPYIGLYLGEFDSSSGYGLVSGVDFSGSFVDGFPGVLRFFIAGTCGCRTVVDRRISDGFRSQVGRVGPVYVRSAVTFNVNGRAITLLIGLS